MNRPLFVISLFIIISFLCAFLYAQDTPRIEAGKVLFERHCASCHSNGGNVMNPKKTLYRKDLEARNIVTAADILKIVRNPVPAPTHPQELGGMKLFDEKTIRTDDVLKIGDYILNTFK